MTTKFIYNYKTGPQESLPDWAFITLISVYQASQQSAGKSASEAFAELRVGPGHPEEIDVKVTINGIEVDFRIVLERLGASFDEAVANRAAEMFEEKGAEKFFAQIDAMRNLQDDVIEKFRKELGLPERDRYSDY